MDSGGDSCTCGAGGAGIRQMQIEPDRWNRSDQAQSPVVLHRSL